MGMSSLLKAALVAGMVAGAAATDSCKVEYYGDFSNSNDVGCKDEYYRGGALGIECCENVFGFFEIVWILVGLSQGVGIIVTIYLAKTTEVTGYKGKPNPNNGQAYPDCCQIWCCTACAISQYEAGEGGCSCCATPNAKTACCICLLSGQLWAAVFGVCVWQPLPSVGAAVAGVSKMEMGMVQQPGMVQVVQQPPVAPIGVAGGIPIVQAQKF